MIVAVLVLCVFGCDCLPEEKIWYKSEKCTKSNPFYELKERKVPYYTFHKGSNLNVYSITKTIVKDPLIIEKHFLKAQKCYPIFFKEQLGEEPILVDEGKFHFILVGRKDLNGKTSFLKNPKGLPGRELIANCGISCCTQHTFEFKSLDRRSTIYMAKNCVMKETIFHETFHQMICRTLNWRRLEKNSKIETEDLNEYLAERFENYDCEGD